LHPHTPIVLSVILNRRIWACLLAQHTSSSASRQAVKDLDSSPSSAAQNDDHFVWPAQGERLSVFYLSSAMATP
jgi:hypothetical protein